MLKLLSVVRSGLLPGGTGFWPAALGLGLAVVLAAGALFEVAAAGAEAEVPARAAVVPSSAGAGARKGTDWWSFRPLTKPSVPAVPAVTDRARPRVGRVNPIDAFVGAKLQEKGLRPSPEAD